MNPVELSPEAAEMLKSFIERSDAPYRFVAEHLLPFAEELVAAGYLADLDQKMESPEYGILRAYFVSDRLVSARETFWAAKLSENSP